MTQHLQTMMCEYTILIIMLYIGVRCLNQRNNKIIRSFSHFVFGVIAFQIINIPVRMVDAGLVRMPAAVVFVLNCGFMIAETFVTYEWFICGKKDNTGIAQYSTCSDDCAVCGLVVDRLAFLRG